MISQEVLGLGLGFILTTGLPEILMDVFSQTSVLLHTHFAKVAAFPSQCDANVLKVQNNKKKKSE